MVTSTSFAVSLPLAVAVAAVAAAACALAIRLLFPLLRRYALAPPNARSSHTAPTPQGGGIAISGVTLAGCVLAYFAGWPAPPVIVLGAVLAMALLGAADDLRPMAVLPRFMLQFIAVTAVIAALPADARIIPAIPLVAERAAEVIALLWFVNLTNFMDGLDWMMVAEMIPLTAALVVLASAGEAPAETGPAALVLLGTIIGFAPFNAPVARLFMGDVGSLPVGLFTGWMLMMLACDGHLAAALLLPLYFLSDATLTLLKRAGRGEKIWEAHRSHFYQRATDNGHSVRKITTTIFVLNVALALLAGASVLWPGPAADLIALATGLLLISLTLRFFSRRST